jgi:hypothetical protein
MLPPGPKIFHGRESELYGIVKLLGGEAPRIAILGTCQQRPLGRLNSE